MNEQKLSVAERSDEELLKIALTSYSGTNVSEMIKKAYEKYGNSLNTDKLELLLKRISNLTGPRTVEGRIRSLKNLTGGGESKSRVKKKRFDPSKPYTYFLTEEDEIKLYEYKSEKYKNDFTLNESSDQTTLHHICMLEVDLHRLRIRQAEYNEEISKNAKTTIKDPTPQLFSTMAALKKLIESLGVDRKARNNKDDKSKDIASLSVEFEQNKEKELRSRQRELEEEIEGMRSADSERDKQLEELGILGKGIDASIYTKVPD